MSTRSSVFGIAFFFVSSVCAIAGSAAAGGAQIAPTDNSSVSVVKAPTDTGPGFSARDSAGSTGSQTGGSSTSDSASASSAASSNGSGSSASQENGSFDGSSRHSNTSNGIATEIAREKVIDTGDKAVETDKPAKAEPSDKTFAPHLLDTVSDISAVSAQKEQSSASNEGDSRSKAKPAASEDKGDSRPKN